MVWKFCATVVNCRLNRSGTLHDALHGFRAGRGTGTATLEAKLAQELVWIAHEMLFHVFLDMQKVHDSLDRGQCMDILQRCGIGHNTGRLIFHHWESLVFVPKAKSFLGTLFSTGGGSRKKTLRPP